MSSLFSQAPRLVVLCVFTILPTLINCRQFTEYKECCPYCFSRQEKWVRVSPAWNITHDGHYITDFTSPVSVTAGDLVITSLTFQDLEYWIRYGGAPVQLLYTDISHAEAILQEQYIEIDLLTPKDVGGVVTQGGSYDEGSTTLFKGCATWMTSFTVSYLDMTSGVFTYVTGEDGRIKVFPGNQDAETSLVSSFTSTVATTHIRVHPLGVQDDIGDVTHAFVRVTVIVCSMDPCGQAPLHCEVTKWSEWSQCVCQGLEGCHRRSTRTVVRYNACGGTPCPHLLSIQQCIPEDPLWVTVLHYLGALGGLLMLVGFVMAIVIRQVMLERRRTAFRRTRLSREHDRQGAARAAEQRLAEDMSKGNDLSAFEEREISVTRPGLFVYNRANQSTANQVPTEEDVLESGTSTGTAESLRKSKLATMFTGSLVVQKTLDEAKKEEEGPCDEFENNDEDFGME